MNWTHEDHLRSIHEGWKLVNGNLYLYYDSKGLCPFKGTYEIVKHLREKGRTSEWHKEVYMSRAWMIPDQEMAYVEGWGIDPCLGVYSQAIHIFPTHEDAVAHVVKQAQLGSPLHIKALSKVTKERLIRGAT